MRNLNAEAKNAGVLLLNECGLDPGIDHMSAMKIIHNVNMNNGKIISFKSTTGALPAHEANTNPFGYKFSWSPRGVLLASRNPAKWLENGKIVSIPGEKLFENYYLKDVEGIGTFENYPNRDSVSYKQIYGLDDAVTVYRGTFRMTGWCETLQAIAQLGWLNDLPIENDKIITYNDLTRYLIHASKDNNLIKSTAEFLDLKPYSTIIKRLEWLGLFSDINLSDEKKTPLDHLNILTLEKMAYNTNERDMIVMHHEFIIEYDDKKEYITSTLINYGIPGDDSAVARTVALPAAIAVKLILEGIISVTGVYIPIEPNIYEPILKELETMDIVFSETIQQI
jgi:saccharopine dehydrogenase-like NADP-dependent oxidoreductase